MPHDELLSLATNIATQAADLVALRRREGVAVADRKSSSVDVVTHADRESEQLIRRLLAEARPDDSFFGEESGASTGTSGLTWVVDPIDGTVNYLYGIPHYAVSIAVVEGEADPATWRALAGAVVNPTARETYTATLGGGAFLNGERLQVAEAVDLSEALVATGFSYLKETRVEQGRVISQLVPQVRDLRRMGTASLDLCMVASGRVNAYFERSLKPWDHAAGALIAQEAGATVKGWGENAAGIDFILAAEPSVARVLEATLAGLDI
ncbi:inositol monophosphatase family protein [Salinibacterium sp. M195]|uniref:inositol monophosphatase family protein n=1 Tax=Salinibacterium sp. M195 TaxID=2583374 RepID=UPI001C62E276|nr:inositol monophosphatase family protein [Salinibacterium sp. M195]QYH34593.1 inositol monophosphatase [Salinibacterium sp. M195]